MWRDIDWQGRTLHIERDLDSAQRNAVGEVKPGASNRTIPIPDPLYNALKACAGVGVGHIISVSRMNGKPISESTYSRKYARLMTAVADLDDTIERARKLIIPEKYAKLRSTHSKAVIKQMVLADNPRYEELSHASVTAHYFRHNYVTILYAAGVPVEVAANWAGHRDINVTREIYLHLKKETVAKQASALLSFFNSRASVKMTKKRRFRLRRI